MTTQDNLSDIQNRVSSEIQAGRKSIRTDSYTMSIGEVISLYESGDILLNPAFQRLFRWKDEQKTKWIESILIGIPIPEIFVAQRSDGIWIVVDGVQRLSTIYQLVGVLEGETPLTLETCQYIPSVEGLTWSKLPKSTQREFHRSRVTINILYSLHPNDKEGQYELFKRLNTGGTELTDQEVRNCIILMEDEDFFNKLTDLKDFKPFKKSIKLTERKTQEELEREIILRMYIGYEDLVNFDHYEPISRSIMSDFIDKETINVIRNGDIDRFSTVFKKTFSKIENSIGKDFAKKYKDNKFSGEFNISTFEALSVGIAHNIDSILSSGDDELYEKIKEFHQLDDVEKFMGRGVKPLARYKDLLKVSKDFFSENYAPKP